MKLKRLLSLVALLALPLGALAHRLDEYLQATLVAIEPGRILLQITLTPGVEVAGKVLGLIDLDKDGMISASEATAYAESLKRELKLRLDQRELELKLVGTDCSTPAELKTGRGIIQMEFAATAQIKGGGHALIFENKHQTNMSVYLVNALKPRSELVEVTKQTRNENQSTGEIEFSYREPKTSYRFTAAIGFMGVALLIVLARGRRSLTTDGHR
jgi:hypothetical protein